MGQGRELTVFWGTNGARGGRLAWERDVRSLDPDGGLVRRSHGRHDTQEHRDASATTREERAMPEGTPRKQVVTRCARGSIASGQEPSHGGFSQSVQRQDMVMGLFVNRDACG